MLESNLEETFNLDYYCISEMGHVLPPGTDHRSQPTLALTLAAHIGSSEVVVMIRCGGQEHKLSSQEVHASG